MKIASLFSGIGGFEKGILQSAPDTEIIFASEIDKYARQIYKKNFGVEPHGDIRQIEPSDIPDHDILCGGFPCQSFSVAGKRRGFEDTRGTLFFEIVRIAEVKRPKLLFLENVRGLLSHDEGRTFQTILRSLDDVGYDAEWQVFNSKNHGVPQNRERVFIIGHLRGAGTRPIFPITKSNEQVSQKRDGVSISTGCLSTRNQSGQAQWDGSTTLICDSGQGRKDQIRHDVIPPLRANTGAGHNNLVVGVNNPSMDMELRKYGLASTIKPQSGSQCPRIAIPEISNCVDVDGYLRNGVRPRDENSKPQLLPIGYGRIRRLTPIECEKLQGFPIGWTAEGITDDGGAVPISDTQRYKCLGNAVTVNVVAFITEHIVEMLSANDVHETKSYTTSVCDDPCQRQP